MTTTIGHKIPTGVALLALSLTAIAQVSLIPSGAVYEVRVIVLDSFGDPLPEAKLYMTARNGSAGERRIISRRVELAPGEYELVAECPGYSRGHKSIRITDSTVVATIGLAVSEIEGGASAIITHGRLENPNRCTGCSLIRLAPLFWSGDPVEALLTPKGEFWMSGLVPGSYAALMLDENGLRYRSEATVRYLGQKSLAVP